jgi:hypothetical protein
VEKERWWGLLCCRCLVDLRNSALYYNCGAWRTSPEYCVSNRNTFCFRSEISAAYCTLESSERLPKSGGVSARAKHEGPINDFHKRPLQPFLFRLSYCFNFTVTTTKPQIPQPNNESTTPGRLKHGEIKKGQATKTHRRGKGTH